MPTSPDGGDRSKHEREVFDRAAIDVALFVVEHVGRIGQRPSVGAAQIVDVDEHVTRDTSTTKVLN